MNCTYWPDEVGWLVNLMVLSTKIVRLPLPLIFTTESDTFVNFFLQAEWLIDVNMRTVLMSKMTVKGMLFITSEMRMSVRQWLHLCTFTIYWMTHKCLTAMDGCDKTTSTSNINITVVAVLPDTNARLSVEQNEFAAVDHQYLHILQHSVTPQNVMFKLAVARPDFDKTTPWEAHTCQLVTG